MELQHVNNLTDGKVVLLCYGEIGGEKGINGAIFAQEIAYLNLIEEVSELEVRVNSHGGGVLDALNIFNAIRSSKKPCNTIIDGIAASSGGIIAMAGHKRMINDFGRLMVHAPSIADKMRNELDEKTVVMLDQFHDLIADILTANSKHQKDDIISMINAETWFTAPQARENGFIDEIIDTGRQFEAIFNELDLASADLALVVNQLSKYQQNPIDMKEIKNKLGLDATVNDTVVENKIDEILNSAKTAQADLATEKSNHEATKATLADVQNKLSAVNDASAVAAVENAIKDGKFSPDAKDELIKRAKNDLEGFNALVKSIATPAKRITNNIDPNDSGQKADEVIDGKLDGKNLRDLEKSNPALVRNLMSTKPDVYKELYKAQYGVEPKA